MNAHNLLLSCLLLLSTSVLSQVTLYSEDFSTAATLDPQTVYVPGAADRVSWGISGTPAPTIASGKLQWVAADETCSWISETIYVAGYSALKLNVSMSESGNFTGSDSLNVIIIEDGVERVVSAQVANDFESLSIVNAPCTASVSLQVLIHVRSDWFLDAVYLDAVSITGTLDYTDIDLDGVNDASDACIDLDDDGTCDPVDAEIMLMDEDFSSYAVGTGVGRRADDEAGIAYAVGVTGAGEPGWVLLGEEQSNAVAVRNSGGNAYLKYQRTGAATTDTTTVTLMTRCFDLSYITNPKVRFEASEVTDFLADDTNGGFVFKLIEDGVERQVLHLTGEFTSVDSTIGVNAVNKLTIVVQGYAQWESIVQLDGIAVFGGYCQTGKNEAGECQDIGCTDPRACTYSALAITSDVTKCKYLGDSCDDDDATSYSDQYKNAGDGTCVCDGFDLQSVYRENFSSYGAAQGGLDYGYEGSIDLDGDGIQNEVNSSAETEWSFAFESVDYGTGEAIVPSPFYFATKVESSDTIMKAFNTNGNYIRWVTRSIDVSDFDSLYVTGELMGLGNQATNDYAHFGWEDGTTLQSPLLAEITGSSTSTVTVNEKVTPLSGAIRLQVEVENNTSSSNSTAGHGFDDLGVYGLKRGCTDPDASNYETAPSDGFLARSDDGSCQYDWAKVYSRKDGDFDDVVWAGKACSLAGYTCGSSSLYIDIHSVTENGTRHAVISANTQISVPAGNYSLGELTLESGATLVIAEGRTLTVNGDFHHQGGTISGTGRIIVKGEMGLADGLTSVEVHDFTFGAGGSLALQDGDKLLVKGDLTIDDGSAISGRIELTGTGAQTVGGLDVRFDTLRVASNGVTFLADAQIDGVLDIDEGVVNMNGNVLTFSSDAGGTGMLDMIAVNGSLEDGGSAASAVVQRYIAPDGDGVTLNGFTLFSSPLSGATVGDLDNTTGFNLVGFPGTDWPNTFPTVVFWDESEQQLNPPTNLNTPLDTLGGAWIALGGSVSPTLSTSGTLRSHGANAADQTFSLTRTDGTSYPGWNLVFNPFQAALDWSEIYSASTGIQDQYSVYDTQTRSFKRRSTDGTFNTAPTHIAPGQAFWVNLSSGASSGTVNIPTSAISVDGNDVPNFIRNTPEGWDAELVLEIENVYGTGKAVMRFGGQGSVHPLAAHDLSFLSSSSVKEGQIAVWSDDERFLLKGLPTEATMPLFVASRANKPTTLRVVGFTGEAEVCITITDTETGEMVVSRVGDEMTFTLPQHEAVEGRFVLEVKPSAVVSARPPSCPEMLDGRIEVSVGEVPANVLLTDGGDNVLAQILGATGSAVFQDLVPGEYGLVVAGPGLECGTEKRSAWVGPGEQPELLGLSWEVPTCNEGDVELDFELYGHGDFHASLRLGNEEVWSNIEHGGEVSLNGLAPGTYALEVDHVCLEETVVLDLFDEQSVLAGADYDAMVILNPIGGTALEATSTCLGEEYYRWVIDGEVVGENAPLFHPIEDAGGYMVQLEAWNETCSDIVVLPYLVVNWNEAHIVDAPVTVREDAAHWTFTFGRDLGWTQLRMMDAAGRVVWTQQVQADEGYVYRVERPVTAGTYLMQVIGDGGQWGLPLLNAGF